MRQAKKIACLTHFFVASNEEIAIMNLGNHLLRREKMEYALIMTSLVIVPGIIVTGFIIYIEATR